ncbi:MAG: tRNA (adenosine(37)-N6)-threonylcarbamoyltransferase complex ATPase subunit type 1 TsaE [Gammaproteobacteria bacterium RIFCSPHIGHO2_12_FULL_45_12]|nr:MAG: tRNA (adenosine(37)-N6)-threonylcarbamoyltransferase complex ATPase subunit type 1 TsaE [Gammaproteobacteria bacterium RIFCSPHIGHO2_12_FULL_45_12]
MTSRLIKQVATEQAMLALGAQVAQTAKEGVILFLEGSLGAGKTTFARGFLRGLGYQQKVKSPTYTLVEPYQVADKIIYHFDLYRLVQPDQLAHIGIHDYFTPTAICLIEWPEKGVPCIPKPDLVCDISMVGEGREVCIQAYSEKAQAMLAQMS